MIDKQSKEVFLFHPFNEPCCLIISLFVVCVTMGGEDIHETNQDGPSSLN